MTYVHTLDEKAFTRTLWQMCTECIVVFPDGVNVLPWMLCGTNEIGEATAEKMRTARLVVWAQHGIYGAGKDLDETFGLIETAEKAAEIYIKIAHLPLVNTITDDEMHQLETPLRRESPGGVSAIIRLTERSAIYPVYMGLLHKEKIQVQQPLYGYMLPKAPKRSP